MRERPHLVDDVILARIVGRDVRHHEDAGLPATIGAVDDAGDRLTLVPGGALQTRGNQIARTEESGGIPFDAVQAAQRCERPPPEAQLTADSVDPYRRRGESPLQLG